MRYFFLGLVSLLVCMVAAPSVQAASTVTAYVQFSIHDQFDAPVARTPQISVANCDILQIGGISAIAGKPGQFRAALVFSSSSARTGCMLQVAARGFIGNDTRLLSTLNEDQTIDISNNPFIAEYSLQVTVSDETGRGVDHGASVEFGGEAPMVQQGNIYYFAGTGTRPLSLYPAGLWVDDATSGQTTSQVAAGITTPTTISFSGATPCRGMITSGANVTCRAPRISTSVVVYDKFNAIIPDATIQMYTDIRRTQFASDLSIGTAARRESASGVSFALAPGTYYLNITKSTYNDYISSFTVTPGKATTLQVVLVPSANDLISPQLSLVTVESQVVADGTSAAIVSLRGLSNNSTALQGRTIEITSSRKNLETISISGTGVTDDRGAASVYLSSTTPGAVTLSIKIGGVTLSTFPTLVFYEPPQGTGTQNVSLSRSMISSTASPIRGDGQEQVHVTVTVRNEVGSRLSGKNVIVSSSRGGDVLKAVAGTTSNNDGQVEYTFQSSIPGTAIIGATIDGQNMKQEVAVTVSPVVQ